jgi:hypothetical protein
VTKNAATAPAAKNVADRAALRTMSQRRRRVWINVSAFALLTGLMVLLSMAQRDEQAVRSCHDRLAFAADELQNRLSRGVTAVDNLPLPGSTGVAKVATGQPRNEDEAFENRVHYFYNADWWRGRHRRRVVGVCSCAAPHQLFLRPDGRHVIVFDGQRYELRWMTESEFARQAPEFGLDVPP